MKKRKGITLVETLAVIGVILFGLFVLAAIKIKPYANKLVCGVNLKGLGCAKAAKAFRPKILYPYHYGQTDVSQLNDLLKDERNIDVRIRKME